MTGSTSTGALPRGWRDASSADALQLVAEGVATFAGFQMTTILVVRGEEVECVAVAGSEEVRRAALGMTAPTRVFEEIIASSEPWGLLRFIPHDRVGGEAARYTIVPDLAVSDDPDAWHPRDELLIPLHDQQGALRAVLSVDEPLDGRRPGPAQRRLLEAYARHAHRAVLTTLEREELAERLAIAAAARRVVRAAVAGLSLTEVLAESRTALLEGFAADELWWTLFDGSQTTMPTQTATGSVDPSSLDPRIPVIAEAVARHGWRAQEAVTARHGVPLHATLSADPDIAAVAEAFLAQADIGSLLLIPLGAGDECLGMVVLHRRDGAGWTPVETEEALNVGHDLGRAVLNARTYEHELDLVRRLQTVDAYKSQLISTVSHELRTPLTSIVGNLELMQDLLESGDADPTLTRAAAATGRGARRLVALVDDLLLLSRVADPDAAPTLERVDLNEVVAEVVALNAAAAEDQHTQLLVSASEAPAVVLGDAAQLDRVLVNLVSNAVKYSPPGRAVHIGVDVEVEAGVESEGGAEHVVVTCTDQGYGISDADQDHLFREFFRSDDPSVRAISGTGLGLAIAHRVVTSHGGRIEVDSARGRGSTFRVILPRAPD